MSQIPNHLQYTNAISRISAHVHIRSLGSESHAIITAGVDVVAAVAATIGAGVDIGMYIIMDVAAIAMVVIKEHTLWT